MNLLIVDDHKIFLEGLKKLLEKSETIQVVKTSSSPFNVLQYLNGNHRNVDCILTDLNMPELNGVELIKKIKNKYPNKKIVVFSMYCNHQLINELKKLDIDGFIHKSFGHIELLNAIDQIEKGNKYFTSKLSKELINYDFTYSEKNKISDHFAKKYYFTKRELDVLRLIAQNYSSKNIADELFISLDTVSSHRKNLIKKSGCKTTIEFYHLAIEIGAIKIKKNRPH
jgi:DNA-binding NarL/FixJ family response regulator